MHHGIARVHRPQHLARGGVGDREQVAQRRIVIVLDLQARRICERRDAPRPRLIAQRVHPGRAGDAQHRPQGPSHRVIGVRALVVAARAGARARLDQLADIVQTRIVAVDPLADEVGLRALHRPPQRVVAHPPQSGPWRRSGYRASRTRRTGTSNAPCPGRTRRSCCPARRRHSSSRCPRCPSRSPDRPPRHRRRSRSCSARWSRSPRGPARSCASSSSHSPTVPPTMCTVTALVRPLKSVLVVLVSGLVTSVTRPSASKLVFFVQ